MILQRKQITVDGKVYGFVTDENGQLRTGYTVEIRSESNPHKTPYLRVGSATYSKVLAAIKEATA